MYSMIIRLLQINTIKTDFIDVSVWKYEEKTTLVHFCSLWTYGKWKKAAGENTGWW